MKSSIYICVYSCIIKSSRNFTQPSPNLQSVLLTAVSVMKSSVKTTWMPSNYNFYVLSLNYHIDPSRRFTASLRNGSHYTLLMYASIEYLYSILQT